MNLKKFAIHLKTGDNTCPHIRMIWKISVVLNRILLKIPLFLKCTDPQKLDQDLMTRGSVFNGKI